MLTLHAYLSRFTCNHVLTGSHVMCHPTSVQGICILTTIYDRILILGKSHEVLGRVRACSALALSSLHSNTKHNACKRGKVHALGMLCHIGPAGKGLSFEQFNSKLNIAHRFSAPPSLFQLHAISLPSGNEIPEGPNAYENSNF